MGFISNSVKRYEKIQKAKIQYPCREGSPLYMFLCVFVIGHLFPAVGLASSIIAGAFNADPKQQNIYAEQTRT